MGIAQAQGEVVVGGGAGKDANELRVGLWMLAQRHALQQQPELLEKIGRPLTGPGAALLAVVHVVVLVVVIVLLDGSFARGPLSAPPTACLGLIRLGSRAVATATISKQWPEGLCQLEKHEVVEDPVSCGATTAHRSDESGGSVGGSVLTCEERREERQKSIDPDTSFRELRPRSSRGATLAAKAPEGGDGNGSGDVLEFVAGLATTCERQGQRVVGYRVEHLRRQQRNRHDQEGPAVRAASERGICSLSD